MKIDPINGKYVIAVSGGVDSVVLLDLLRTHSKKDGGLELIVAHFDHGIRKESLSDRQFVEELAAKYGLKFHFLEGKLGSNASEDVARKARYEFLNSTVYKEEADGLVTAHHQDDLIETAIINIVRGTGRKGLSSLSSNAKVVRPMLGYPKADIKDYATANNLVWREDSTNQDIKYLRNYIRIKVIPKLDSQSRARFVELISKQGELNAKIDKQLAGILNEKASVNKLPRLWLNSLDSMLSREVLAAWLRQNDLPSFDRQMIERLASSLKTSGAGKKIDVYGGWLVAATRDNLALEHLER